MNRFFVYNGKGSILSCLKIITNRSYTDWKSAESRCLKNDKLCTLQWRQEKNIWRYYSNIMRTYSKFLYLNADLLSSLSSIYTCITVNKNLIYMINTYWNKKQRLFFAVFLDISWCCVWKDNDFCLGVAIVASVDIEEESRKD